MTQPSLTTTFDTSLIDLAALPGARSYRSHQQQNRGTSSSSFNAAGSFSTTEPDTEDDGPENADDFAADAPSQAVADSEFATSLGKAAELSSSEDDESEDEGARGESPAAQLPGNKASAATTPAARRPPPQQVGSAGKATPRPSQALSAQARRKTPASTAKPTITSAKHSQPSSSSSSSSSSSPSPSSPSNSPPSKEASRPPAKRRKMAACPSPPPSSGPVERAAKTATPVRHMETTAAYDAWAAVYDEDGNVLQGIDDLELEGLLPAFLRKSVGVVEGGEEAGRVLRVLDLGCGTGRNTEKVVGWAIGRGQKERLIVEVVGVDASKGMLDKAKAKLTPLLEDADGTNLSLLNHDPFQNTPTATLPPPLVSPFHAVMSTLVLEHLPLPVFFETLASLLAPGGYALVTNMHPEMGAKSQAGFVSKDAEGRTIKVRGKSWAYGVQETVEAAKVVGLETVDVLADEGESRSEAKGVRERGIDEALIKSGKIGERGWKWVGVKVWYGFVVRKVGGEKK